jgi:hypothetical protein
MDLIGESSNTCRDSGGEKTTYYISDLQDGQKLNHNKKEIDVKISIGN